MFVSLHAKFICIVHRFVSHLCFALALLAVWILLPVIPHAAQTDTPATTSPSPQTSAPLPSPAPTPADTAGEMQRRIARARALAVVGQTVTAERELEAIRVATARDPSQPARSVAGILLMGLYIEQADYRRARTLLDDAAAQNTRSATSGNPADSEEMRTYYAIAGQLLNGLRSRLDRYRIFNVPVGGSDVPPEVTADVDGMRLLLDALLQQGRSARGADGAGGAAAALSPDAAALFEDAVGLRVNLARDLAERTTLTRELADARQRLAAVEPRLQSNGQPSARRTTLPARNAAGNTSLPLPTPANTNPATPIATPTPTATPTVIPTPTPTPLAAVTATTPTPDARPASPRNGATETASPENVAATSAQPLEVGSLVERATQRVSPAYPSSARTARVTGVVTVYVVLNERGSVEEVQRAQGPQLLRRAAEDAARRWKFRPVTVQGQPTRAIGYISFNFTL